MTSILRLTTFAIAWGVASAGAFAQSSTYAEERAACLAGKTGQSQANCLREAAAAEQQRKQLTSPSAEQLRANAIKRCEALPPADRPACEAMALGEGNVSGSVKAGGTMTTLTTVVPASAPASGTR